MTLWPRSVEILSQLPPAHHSASPSESTSNSSRPSLPIAESILQQAYCVRTSAAYDKDGNEVFGRGWSWVEGLGEDTNFGFATVLRQRYVEGIIGEGITIGLKGGQRGEWRQPAEFRSLVVNEGVKIGEKGRVTATIWDAKTGKEYSVRCRYVIGCDGSRTAVRGAAGIESDGSRTEDKWVRIDGVLKHTTMPKPRSYGALESPVYGNVLWIPLDHGATRIGYAFKEERQKLYKEFDQEAFVKEAKLSVAPFEIEYERVDWASVYIVGQRVARKFFTQGCVFLAGDACHTHSSGAGQGMNAGVHDAVNLGWKLAMVLNGQAKAKLLDTYEEERRPNAQKLIKYDEDISTLVTGRLPKNWTGDPNENPNIVLGEILQEAKGFNAGLTISYGSNMLNIMNTTNNEGEEATPLPTTPPQTLTPALPGHRAPDAILNTPALLTPTRLHTLTPNNARFHLLLFAGCPSQSTKSKSIAQTFTKQTKTSFLFSSVPSTTITTTTTNTKTSGEIQLLQSQEPIEDSSSHLHDTSTPTSNLPLDFLTIFKSPDTDNPPPPTAMAGSTWELLETAPLGRMVWDLGGRAHARYGIGSCSCCSCETVVGKGGAGGGEDKREGKVDGQGDGVVVAFILRPDGWIGMRVDVLEGKEEDAVLQYDLSAARTAL